MIYKTLHRKQWSTRYYTENNDLQDTTQKTMIYKTLHITPPSSNSIIWFVPQNQQASLIKGAVQWSGHRKQWSTRYYTENNDLQDTTQKTMIYKTLHRKQWSTRHYTENNDL
jgi:hypothetical protein